MRKLLYTFAALAGMLAVAASCQREAPGGTSQDGDLIDVSMSFTVDDGRPATKTMIGDGTTASNLSFYAYDEHNNYLSALSSSATINYNAATHSGSVSFKVVKGMQYQFVFLATAPDIDYFSLSEDKKTLTVDYNKINTAQNEKSDFFYYKSGVVTFTASGESKPATLKRPLAQLNVGSLAADMEVASKSGIKTDALETGYVLTSIPSTLNLLDGTVGDEIAEITLAPDTSPSGNLSVSGSSATYAWVSTAYVLVDPSGKNTDVTLNVNMTNNSGQALTSISRSITAVPLKRNYRTNILGNIFSIDAVFNVSVDSDFEDTDGDENPDDINVDYVSVSNVENLNTELEANKDKEVDQFYTVSTVEDNSGSSAHTSTIEIPTGTKAESLTFQLGTIESGVTEIIVKDEDASAGEYAKTVTVDVPAGANLSTITFTVETPSAHVVIKSDGNIIHELNAATGGSTLVVAEGTKIEKLVVKEGNVQIEKGGTVKDIQRAAGNEADIYVEMAAGTVWTNMDTNVAADAKLFPEHTIASVADFKAFRDAVNADDSYTFKGITVKLTSNLDLGNEAWTPIGLDSYNKNFKGVFDGQNHTISNLKVTHAKTAGLFGCMNQGAVRNLVVDGLEITSNHYAGGIVAWIEKGAYDVAIDHCIVKNGTIASSPELVDSKYDNGDKVGGIIGYAYKPTGITDNTVVNLTITAYRDLAGVAGYATATTITGNIVKDVNIIQSLANGYKAEVPTTIGAIVGRTGDPNTVANNTEENVTISTVLTEGINVNAEGQYVIVSRKGFEYFRDLVNAGNPFGGKTFILDTDIDLNKELWVPIGINADADATAFQGTFDGGNHTISNLNVDLTAEPAYRSAGLFGATRGAVVIKNFTVSGASIKHLSTGAATDNGIAVVVGSLSYSGGGTVDNVHVLNATIEGNRYLGGIAGYAKGTIKDCSIDGLTIVATPDNLSGSYDNGDKVGGILGFDNQGSTITGNAVKNFSIKGYRDLGGIIGCAYLNSTTVSGNTVTEGTITVDQKTNSYGTKTANAAAIVGRLCNGALDADTNTSSNVIIKEDVASGISRTDNIYTVTSTAVENTVISTIYANAKNCSLTEFTINLPEGEFVLPSIVQQNISIHFDGANENTVLSVSGASQAYHGCTVDFSDLTLVGDTDTDFTKNHGLYHLTKETYTNVTFTKFRFFYAPECTLNNCKFVQDAYEYVFCSYGTKTMVLNDCEISCVGKAAKIYGVDSANPATVTFNRCKFTADGSARQSAGKDWKAALEIDAKLNNNTHFTVNVNNTVSCTGFHTSENTAIAKTDANYQGTLYNVDNGSGSKIVINIDGVQQTQAW